MTLERFETLLDLYGPNIADWPETDRQSADQLLAESDAAQELMADAAFMMDALDSYTVAEPSPEFDARLLDLAPTGKPVLPAKTSGGFFSWFDVRMFSTAGAALACAAFGLVIGLNAIEPADTTTTNDEAEMFMTAALTSYDTAFWEGDEG